MSQYRISKKRLAEIIKEEYRSLHEPTRTDEVLEGEFGPGIGTGLDDQIRATKNVSLVLTLPTPQPPLGG